MKMRAQLRLLLITVAAMLAGLVASLAILARAVGALTVANAVIIDNAAPTVVALDSAQARLRELHALVLERELGAPGDPAVRDAAVAAARNGLARSVDEYLALPTDPGEAALQRTVQEALARFDDVMRRMMTLPPGPRGGDVGVQHDFEAAIARLGRELAQASDFSANLAKAEAHRAVRVSHTLLPAAAMVEALTILAAAVTLLLTYRAVRRAEALAERSLTSLQTRAEELEGFAGRVAHDLLSPLMTVALALDLADRRLTEPADQAARSAVARATGTLQRVRGFVSDLLEFARAAARPPPGVRASVDAVVREIADEFTPIARDAGVELHVEPARPGRVVACSAGVLTSVLSNLVQNAIQYIGHGANREVTIRTLDRDDAVQLEVEDTGPGLAPEDRVRLFAPHVRGRDAGGRGLGLGLATVRRLVESHGGRVGVRSAPGGGSVFWFTVPPAAAWPSGG